MELIQKYVSIAGIRMMIQSNQPFELSESCRNFVCSPTKADLTLTICNSGGTDEQILKLENRVARLEDGAVFRHGQKIAIVRFTGWKENEIGWYCVTSEDAPNQYQLFLLKNQAEYRSINPLSYVDLSSLLLRFQTLLLHSSLVDCRGHGIVFTAPSGTGKSTQAQLWETYRQAIILNGDRSMIRKTVSGYRAYGSPYAGSSHIYQNQSVPLEAIVVLRQAKQNRIHRMKMKEAYLCLLSEMSISSWNRDTVDGQCNLALDLLERVPVYFLECLPDQGAVAVLSRELGELNWEK